ncbi:MAG: UDP-N-acetylmuramoyl-L-alanine--D-glutamate ligase, partial [Microbacteriaceae bacterium]|nr:UDP-N-acetylmuramoyl-L-alanine--D-glutamate ligase [Burkholderiaceae bacterium]
MLVLGLGESGLAMARWCARHGARVQVWDSREQPPQAAALREAVSGVVLFSGVLTAESLVGVQMLLKSPGLAPHDARIAPVMDAARATGIVIGGELDLFARALADLKADRGYEPKVLAITGTNGKTTTTAMAALLIARCGLRVTAA